MVLVDDSPLLQAGIARRVTATASAITSPLYCRSALYTASSNVTATPPSRGRIGDIFAAKQHSSVRSLEVRCRGQSCLMRYEFTDISSNHLLFE